jgi:MoaA/NifB/PqqE/SkfB family radical SAM enzyme
LRNPLPTQITEHYDATRDLSGQAFRSACYAPYTSLYFDTRGNVKVCCHNSSHMVGNVSRQSIDEIWKGEAIKIVRRAVLAYDLSRGCAFCEWQLTSRSYANLAMRKWDSLATASLDPPWPQMMEFSISNTCNLECIMCDGKHSSTIRANREKRLPLPNPYSDIFFEQLRKYLPNLRRARFLGGEPFLQEGCYRIWGMLIDDHLDLPCHVTTNGTIFNARTEGVLAALPFGISISLDGIRKETIEGIRLHARYDSLLQNVLRFRAYTLAKKTSFGLTYCLMRRNWQELGDFCLFADSLDCPVGVNLVRRPAELSLFALPRKELQDIADTMEEQAALLLPRLNRNREVWLGELQRLRQHALGAVQPPKLMTIADQPPA